MSCDDMAAVATWSGSCGGIPPPAPADESLNDPRRDGSITGGRFGEEREERRPASASGPADCCDACETFSSTFAELENLGRAVSGRAPGAPGPAEKDMDRDRSLPGAPGTADKDMDPRRNMLGGESPSPRTV